MGDVVVEELDGRRRVEGERDVGAIGLTAQPIVLVPRAVQRGLVLPVPRRQIEAPLPHAVVLVEAEVRELALREPVGGARQLLLEAARHRDRRRLGAGGSGRRGNKRRDERCEQSEGIPSSSHSDPPRAPAQRRARSLEPVQDARILRQSDTICPSESIVVRRSLRTERGFQPIEQETPVAWRGQ